MRDTPRTAGEPAGAAGFTLQVALRDLSCHFGTVAIACLGGGQGQILVPTPPIPDAVRDALADIPVAGTVEPGHAMGASRTGPASPPPALASAGLPGAHRGHRARPAAQPRRQPVQRRLHRPARSAATWVPCCYPTCAPARPRRAPPRRPRPPRTTPHGRTAPGHRRAALPLTRTPVPPGARRNSITCPAGHSPRRRQTGY